MAKESSKLIAKNTAMLYFRMLFTMGVTLYTSRIVLSALGADDYGLYNVVGSIVTMSVVITTAISNATQRFLSFELGSNNLQKLKQVFSLSITISVILALFILILAETVGLWFLNNKLVIPPERMHAALWVYQFSIFSFLLSILQTPFNASIIAHEEMKVYAYVSILEVLLKLSAVSLLVSVLMDKLILYALLMFSISFVVMMIYRIYCSRHFKECRFRFYWDKELFKSMMGFAGWNLFGTLSSVCMDQGINILLNIFCGLGINAARGVAVNVKTAIYSFCYNYQTAVNPQIVKSYAANDKNYMIKLILQSSKFSFLLLFMIVCPVLIETDYILDLWLKDVPAYSVIFCRLILILVLVDCFAGPLGTAAAATKNIKIYSISTGLILIMGLPISWVFLHYGFAPQVTLVVHIFIAILALGARLLVLKKLISLNISIFIKEVILRILPVCLISLVIPLISMNFFHYGFLRFLFVGFGSVLINGISIYYLSFDTEERCFVTNLVRTKFLDKYRK
jgi:O-antigen/teichoic acid export membrane protein